MRGFLAVTGLLTLTSCGIVAINGSPGVVPVPAAPATPVVAAPPVQPPEVRLVAAIEGQGCVLNSATLTQVQLDANMTQPELRATMNRLEELGRVRADGQGGLRVITDRCA